jgi:protoporphyrinogen oxidase
MIAIIGAGPAGLSAAAHLKKLGVHAQVFEKDSRPGGLIRTEQVGNYQFDYAGHLLHFRDPSIEKWVMGLAGKNSLFKIKRRSFIFSKNVLTPYPFQVHTHGLPKEVIRDCLLGFMESKLNPSKTKPANFKEWILINLGKGFADNFLFPFNQKFWKMPLEKLDAQWAEWSIPIPEIKDVIEGALGLNTGNYGYNVYFYYPKSGGIEKIAEFLAKQAEKISLNREIVAVHLKYMQGELANGGEFRYDKLVSTMPLKELIKRLEGAPAGIKKAGEGLAYRSVLCVNVGIKGPGLSSAHWIYYPEDKYVFYRSGFYSNFIEDSSEYQSVVLEISYDPESEPDPEKVSRQAVEQFRETGLLTSDHTIEYVGSMNIPYAYAVYDRHRAKVLPGVLKFLEQNKIYSIGRYGRWEYSTIEDALREGRDTAAKISK